ncbi:MAG: hypothetical protein AAF915_13885 [Cyanobacteria bacterium P01_D01_bin.50]
MEFVDLIKAALSLTVAVVGVIITVWHKILEWAQTSLFPWLKENLPHIVEQVKDAFIWIDNEVAVPIRQIVKKAWEKLRNYLLQTVTEFERRTESIWVRRITSFVIQRLEQAQPKVKKVVIEEDVNWDELPPDVKKFWIRDGRQNLELDVTQIRDKEIEELKFTD